MPVRPIRRQTGRSGRPLRPGRPSRSWHPWHPLCIAVLAVAAGAYPPAAAAEPPEREGLGCTLTRQALDGALRLEIRFSNTQAAGSAPLTLTGAVHLVLYRDAAAADAMETTARIERLQRSALVVPAQGSATSLFVADERQTEALLCNGGRPAAAGLHFYEFSRRPTFRCLLDGQALAALPMKAACPPAADPARR